MNLMCIHKVYFIIKKLDSMDKLFQTITKNRTKVKFCKKKIVSDQLMYL